MTAPAQTQERKGKLGKWKPKHWRPEYDRMVAYSVLGKSNIWIAKFLGFTPEHVSNILHQPEAVELAEKLHAKLREGIEANIPAVLDEIALKAVSRVKQLIDSDELMIKSPFAVVDRSLDVLKGLNHLKRSGDQSSLGGGTTVNIGTAIIAPQQTSDILEGLQKVAEVKRLHRGE